MTEKLVLVTGACGEIGQALVQGLAKQGGYLIVTADLAPLPDHIKAISTEHALFRESASLGTGAQPRPASAKSEPG